MKAFTLATGGYAPLARITATCFEWATGIAPTVITATSNGAHAAKLTLPDEKQYLFFDADILFRRKVQLPEVPPEAFAAARLGFGLRGQRELAERFRLPRPMLSTGLFIASSAHRAVMGRATELLHESPVQVSGHEEPWLNVALAERSTPLRRLPNDLNQQAIKSAFATTLHFCQEPGPSRKLAAVHYHLSRHAPGELRAFLAERGVWGTQ